MSYLLPLWNSSHRRKVLNSGATLAITLAITASVLLWSSSRQTEAAATNETEQINWASSSAAAEELAVLTADLPQRMTRALALRTSGIDKPVDRVGWAESVNRTLGALAPLSYSAQISHARQLPLPASLQEWYDTRGATPPELEGVDLDLQIHGLQEDELATALQQISAEGGGVTRIEHCKLIRRPDSVGIDATCTLRRHGIGNGTSVQPANASGLETSS